MPPTIRAPRADELELLRDVERAASALFADVGLADVAAHEPESIESLARYRGNGRSWVVADDNDQPVAYAVVDIVDGLAHLEQISVSPDHGRQGLGAALLAHVCEWAREQHHDAVTLTTFKDVPWNAPFYAKHGFHVMTEEEIGPELRQLRVQEAEHGLDPETRVCMSRHVRS